jgi:2,4-dienoyl-CoA reductase-like NADH-dependent reductase (Old Yellow Enzyme family)
MTRSFSPAGVPPPEVAAYYRRRAEGHAGLILTEGTAIERPSAKNDPGVPHFYGEAALEGWSRVVREVHEAGGLIAPQLWHVGPRLDSKIKDWVAPGPVDTAGGLRHLDRELLPAMTEEAIADTLAAYGRSAANAARLGFDAVEIHGAHGYLIDDFFWHRSNTRTDRWGGPTVRDRTRFAVEVVKAVRAELPEDMPLLFRLSQWKGLDYDAKVASTPAEMEEWFGPLADAGVDVFHCSQRRFWKPSIEGSDLNLAGWAKRVTGKITITVGSVGLSGEFIAGGHSTPVGLDELLRRFERGEFDLVAVGRALLADPNWIDKVREGRTTELKSYDPILKQTLY